MTAWNLVCPKEDGTHVDAHVWPEVESTHHMTRNCYCSPKLLCRNCSEGWCGCEVMGRTVVHNEAS